MKQAAGLAQRVFIDRRSSSSTWVGCSNVAHRYRRQYSDLSPASGFAEADPLPRGATSAAFEHQSEKLRIAASFCVVAEGVSANY
jgi:hypothetical protein